MNWRAIFAIARKDLKVVWQNKGVSIPIIILPLILFVALPLMLGLVPTLSVPSDSFAEVQQMMDTMPPALRASLVGLTLMQQTVVLFLVYIMAPLYLIVPMMVSSVVAADSFAGEKERKTLEGLLHLPANDRDLIAADVLSQKETLELIRAYYKLGERPRRRLLDLAKALQDENTDAA